MILYHDKNMKKIIIYGAGADGNNFIKACFKKNCFFEKNKVVGVVDKDAKKQGNMILGLPIVSPQILYTIEFDLIIIASSKFAKEIEMELLTLYHVKRNKLASPSNLIFAYQNMGDIELNNPDIKCGDLFELYRSNNLTCPNDLEKFFFSEKHNLMSKWLHYFEVYDKYFHQYREKEITFVEIGVYRGGSLQMWKNYFGKKARIIGIDIDSQCKQYEEDGISVRIGSQEDRGFLKEFLDEFPQIDILLDDGGHSMNQQIISFEEIFSAISDGGIYVCEDLHTSYMEGYGSEDKENTFIEYSKKLIDDMHAWYAKDSDMQINQYTKTIKALHYYDSMLVIEKKNMGEAVSIDSENL